MQLAGSGNGTPPCHRPITEHAGRTRRQLPSDDNRGAVQGKMGEGGAGGESDGGGGGSGGGAGGGEGSGGALRDQSLQQYITTQLPTPPTIRCPRCLATEPPPLSSSSFSSLLSLKMPSYKQAGVLKHTFTHSVKKKCYTDFDWQFKMPISMLIHWISPNSAT